MVGDLTVTKVFAIALGATLMPCLAVAVNMPSGVSPEEVDTTALGTGQDAEPAPAVAGWSVQLGAYGDKDAAQARLDHIAGLSPDEFSHAASAVVPFAWGGGRTLYRARFTGFSEEDAKALCARLDRLGESCFAVASEIAKPDRVIEAAAAAKPLLDSSRLVSNEDLSTMRGGFFTAGGAQFDFGASIRTLVNGQLALQTNLSWTPAGSVVQQLAGLGTSIRAQVAADLAKAGITAPAATNPVQIAAPLQTGNTAQTGNSGPAGNPAPAAPINPASAGAATFVANAAPNVLTHVPVIPADTANNTGAGDTPAATGAAAPMVLTGVQIQSPAGGTTQVFANVTASQIQNIILNSASNQTITQDTNLTLTIYNFSAWQQQLAQHALSAQLANEILAASGFRH